MIIIAKAVSALPDWASSSAGNCTPFLNVSLLQSNPDCRDNPHAFVQQVLYGTNYFLDTVPGTGEKRPGPCLDGAQITCGGVRQKSKQFTSRETLVLWGHKLGLLGRAHLQQGPETASLRR